LLAPSAGKLCLKFFSGHGLEGITLASLDHGRMEPFEFLAGFVCLFVALDDCVCSDLL
jgi:hypothetical protein